MARKTLDEEEVVYDQPLITKYRPDSLVNVLGQDEVVRSIRALVASSAPHAYLFTGPSGCGKTTLARIVAGLMQVEAENVLEVDAATNSGIDAMREVSGSLRYLGFGQSSNRALIIDECHALSAQAWQSLLKVIEEPPPHAYFLLCTTNPGKVPQTIVTRCVNYQVRELSKDDLWDLLEDVAERERMKVPEAVMQVVVRAAEGSARRALTALQMVFDCQDPKEAALLLSQPGDDAEIIELCRELVTKGRVSWSLVQEVLLANKDTDPEGMRLTIVNYVQTVLLNTKGTDKSAMLLDVLAQFMRPVSRSEKMAGLLLAFGNLTFK